MDKEKKLIDGELSSINKEIDRVKHKRQEYNVIAQKADNMIKIDRINAEFDFIDKKLREFEKLESIDSVRTSVTNLFDLVQKKEKEVFDDIIKQFSGFFNDFDSTDIILESIDFKAIENEATSKSKETYVIEPERVITHTTDPDERIPAKYGTRINEEQKLREFKALTLKRARTQRDKLLPQVKEKVDNMKNQIFEELNAKLNDEQSRLEKLKSQLARKEEFKAENDRFIDASLVASKELLKHVQDYGFEF